MPVEAYVFVTTDEPVDETDLLTLANDLAEAVGSTRFTHHYDGEGIMQVVLESEYKFLPEGLPHRACVLQVRMEGAYYGPEYERGYWPEIAAVLEFLCRRLPQASVWYGRDDGGWVKQVTHAALDEMWSHWATYGGRPYYKETYRKNWDEAMEGSQ